MTLTRVNVSGSSNFDNDTSNTEIKRIDLSALLDDGLLLNTIFRYSSTEDLVRLRQASSYFHSQIQTFWYRFYVRQQMYYLTQYALEIVAKRDHPFRRQQIKQALCDGFLSLDESSFEVGLTVAWLIDGLLSDTSRYLLPNISNPFLSAMLSLLYQQSCGNDTLCQKSYRRALEHIDAMTPLMEPLLKALVSSVAYQPGDVINAFQCQFKQLKPHERTLFWSLDVIIAHCGKERLPVVIKKLLPFFKEKDWQIRRSAVHAWVELPIYHPTYPKKRWAKHLYDRLIDKTPCVSPAAVDVSDEIARYCGKRKFSSVLTAICSLFDDKYVDIEAIDVSVKLVKYCEKNQFTYLMGKLLPQLKAKEDDRCRAAIRAWIEIAKDYPKFEWRDGLKPLFLLFAAKEWCVRQVIVQESIKLAKVCNNYQFANLQIALHACFQDSKFNVRKAVIRPWIKLANGYPDRQYKDWRKPLYLLLAEKDLDMLSPLIKFFPEIVNYCDEKQFDRQIVTSLLRRSFHSAQNLRVSSAIARHCKKERFANLLQSLILSADAKLSGIVFNDILVLGSMVKSCSKSQFEQVVTAVFSWLSDNDVEDFDDDFEPDTGYYRHDTGNDACSKSCRREASIRVAVEIAKYCNKEQFDSVYKKVLARLRDHAVGVRERTLEKLPKIAKHCDQKQAVALITALIHCPANGYNRIEGAREDALNKITGYGNEYASSDKFIFSNKYMSSNWSLLFWSYLSNKNGGDDYDPSTRKTAIQICAGRTKHCDIKQFSALITRLLPGCDRLVRIISRIIQGTSANQRKEIMPLLVEGEAINLSTTLIIQDVILLDRLSDIEIDKTLYSRLIKANVFREPKRFKQEKQEDFKAAIDDLKKDNGNAETQKEAGELYDQLLSRSAALASIENRQAFLMSFFLLKLEAFVVFSALRSSPSERKAVEKQAQLCATFFCRYHSLSMIIKMSKALPHQSFACPKAIKTVINGYLPRRVYALRKRIRLNPRYSTEVSVARETLFSQSNKKRKARTTEPDNQLKVTTKRSRR
jgi:hypothetical protein